VNLRIISKFPQLLNWLSQRVGYLGDEYYSIQSNQFKPSDKANALMIVSRKHYQEVWNTYPAVSLTELRSVLKLQKNLAGNNRVLQYKYQNKELDGFDVKTIHFSTKINDLVSKKLL
jgi:hypothetical protein